MKLNFNLKRSATLLAFTMSLCASAERIETRIQRVLDPRDMRENFLVLAKESGRVLHATPNDAKLIEKLQVAADSKEYVFLDLAPVSEKQSNIVGIEISHRPIPAPLPIGPGEYKLKFDNSGYSPTNVADPQALFDDLNPGSDATECFQRAHHWAHYMWTNYGGLKSMKIFIFFTDSYIREYNYEWWFHVAPYVMHKGSPVVLDRTFSDEPQDLTTWKNDYIYSGNSCPTVTRYSDYENNQENQDCYFMKVPMYYFQPTDMENFEHNGEAKTDWVDWEVDSAYSAFSFGSGGLVHRFFDRIF